MPEPHEPDARRFHPNEFQNLLVVVQNETGRQYGQQNNQDEANQAEQQQFRGFDGQKQSAQVVGYTFDEIHSIFPFAVI